MTSPRPRPVLATPWPRAQARTPTSSARHLAIMALDGRGVCDRLRRLRSGRRARFNGRDGAWGEPSSADRRHNRHSAGRADPEHADQPLSPAGENDLRFREQVGVRNRCGRLGRGGCARHRGIVRLAGCGNWPSWAWFCWPAVRARVVRRANWRGFWRPAAANYRVVASAGGDQAGAAISFGNRIRL